jgi:hypothetical protein
LQKEGMTAVRHAPEGRRFFRITTQGTGAKARGLRWALCAATLAATLAASLFAPVMARPGHAPTAAPLTLVVPGDFPIDDNFGHGCWVRLYDGIDFKGNELILAGPLALPRLGAVAAPWRDWDSASEIQPEPRARVVRRQPALRRLRRPVEQQALDALVIVEPLQVYRRRRTTTGRHVQRRRAMAGQRHAKRVRQGGGPHEAGEAAAAGGVGLQHVHGTGFEQAAQVQQVETVLAGA